MVIVMYSVFIVLVKIKLFKCLLYLDLTPYSISMMLIPSTSDFKNSLQKNVYIVAVLIWRLLKTATIIRIIRQFNNCQNSPSKGVI